MISKLVTVFAPCLLEVPMQSEPVSPPPITITFLFLAKNLVFRSCCPSTALLLWGKKSIACSTPLSSEPGMGSSLLIEAPVQMTIAS